MDWQAAGDLVRDHAQVVGHGHHRTLAGVQLAGDQRDAGGLARVQPVPPFHLQGLHPHLLVAGGRPQFDAHAVVPALERVLAVHGIMSRALDADADLAAVGRHLARTFG